MLSGSCLCGLVKYSISGEIMSMGFCHCRNCQKFTGSAFNAACWLELDSLQWQAGEEHVTRYESSPGIFRCFCQRCGSSLLAMAPDHNAAGVHAGTLDDDPEIRPSVHIYTSSKACWYDIRDQLPQYVTE